MSTILYSYVGELAKFEDANLVNTPDGMRWCRPQIIDALLFRGHRVIAVQKRLETTPYEGVEYSDGLPGDADLLFCEWRWKTYKGETPDVVRQSELLNAYHGNIPVVLFDAAFQIDAAAEQTWPKAIVADPSIEPRYLTRKRERMFFWSDFRTFMGSRDPADLVNYGYIGNKYDRQFVFEKFYINAAGLLRRQGIQTVVCGNWINRSADRPNPDHLIKSTSNVMFTGRQSFHESMQQLNNFIATTHLCKPEYDLYGNITVRFTESFAVGTPALIPSSFKDSNILGKEWKVSSTDDVVSKLIALKRMSLSDRLNVLDSQQKNLTSRYNMHVNEAVKFIESKL